MGGFEDDLTGVSGVFFGEFLGQRFGAMLDFVVEDVNPNQEEDGVDDAEHDDGAQDLAIRAMP